MREPLQSGWNTCPVCGEVFRVAVTASWLYVTKKRDSETKKVKRVYLCSNKCWEATKIPKKMQEGIRKQLPPGTCMKCPCMRISQDGIDWTAKCYAKSEKGHIINGADQVSSEEEARYRVNSKGVPNWCARRI